MKDCSVAYHEMTSGFHCTVRCLLLSCAFDWEADGTVGQLAPEYSEVKTCSEFLVNIIL